MHGIQHLYRQHALEKQISADGWHSAQSHISNQAHLYHNYPNMRVNSTTSSSGADSPSGSMAKSPNWSQDKVLEQLTASSPQPVPELPESRYFRRNSPTNLYARSSESNGGGGSFRRSSATMRRNVSPAFGSNSPARKLSDGYGSPPSQLGFFPHDLDDIYESNSDLQYHTYGGYSTKERPSINSIFHRAHASHSLDEYSPHASQTSSKYNLEDRHTYRSRFDNSSFAKALSGGDDEEQGKKHHHHHHNHHSHHHHSLHEMLKHFGKKVHIWSKKGHHQSSANMSLVSSPTNDPQENFRSRSKSLDVHSSRKMTMDCETTYRIYEKIVKEGAHMRRASADLEKRRASLGASRGLRSDGTLDPYHAAILFRDSRGLPVADPFLEKVSLSDLRKYIL
ncbi:unnamed protein product [Hermetia illucens]|uniref:Uncharacterized protein n=1 Tax=Hermetia illucens TaxID=343691 RepID=A0A7R8V699_HERIL|nr:unnamed protein product [Hermetia illucens]